MLSSEPPQEPCFPPAFHITAEYGHMCRCWKGLGGIFGVCLYVHSCPGICHWALCTMSYWAPYLTHYSHSEGLFSNQIKCLPMRRAKKYSGYHYVLHKKFSYHSCALRPVQWNKTANTALKLKEKTFFFSPDLPYMNPVVSLQSENLAGAFCFFFFLQS